MTSKAAIDAMKEQILKLRKTGLSIEAIGLELYVDKDSVRRVLKEHDPKPSKHPRRQQILDMYDEGATYEEIAQTMKLAKSTICNTIWEFSTSFQPLEKLNHHTSQMTKAELIQRRRMMSDFLAENGIHGAWVAVMRDYQYRIDAETKEDVPKILAAFPKSDIFFVKRNRIIVRKVFSHE